MDALGVDELGSAVLAGDAYLAVSNTAIGTCTVEVSIDLPNLTLDWEV